MKLSNVRTKPAPADLLVAAAIVILIISPFIVESFNVTAETKAIAYQLMYAVSIMMGVGTPNFLPSSW